MTRSLRNPLWWVCVAGSAACVAGALGVGAPKPIDPARVRVLGGLTEASLGRADMSLRNSGYPETYLAEVRVDLTAPRKLTLVWKGPGASNQPTGPYPFSPGKGDGVHDCNDPAQSNVSGSLCTPKGTFKVIEFSDSLDSHPTCRFISWFHKEREIAIHSHTNVPECPSSLGCVRVGEPVAQLVHNNAVAGVTRVTVDGTLNCDCTNSTDTL